MTNAQSFILPDLEGACPFPCNMSPLYEKARAETTAWVNSFKVFDSGKLKALEAQNYELLAAMTFPDAAYDELRICCDFISLLFVYDDYSDEEDGAAAKSSGEVFLRAMKGLPVDDSNLSRMSAEYVFWILYPSSV